MKSLSFLNAMEKSMLIIREPPTNNTYVKLSEWPESNGTKENYSTFIDLKFLEINVDFNRLRT
ncbi:hypothetical protein HI914_07085 [Erysiphe necator]|nr:hypothetical protein HI914_07085 [Erysiphe necator]